MKKSEVLKIKQNVTTASLALVIVLAVLTSATFAWYIYNTNAHTTKVHLAAGASSNLVISDTYDSTSYGSATLLTPFAGRLTPVSTNSIMNTPRFNKATAFSDGGTKKYASSFAEAAYGIGAENQDYYMTSVFLKTNGGTMDVYLSDIAFTNNNSTYPISTAIRIGLVVHDTGKNQPESTDYIFEIDQSHHAGSYYNTLDYTYDDDVALSYSYVLNQAKSPVDFTPLNSDNFCIYNSATGETSLKANSQKLCTVSGSSGGYGDAVQIDVYIYLEGCDPDCTTAICDMTLSDIALQFAGRQVS